MEERCGDQCSHEARKEEFDKLVPSEFTPDVINSVDGDGDVRYIGWHGCLAEDVLALELFGNDEVEKTKRLAQYIVVDQTASVQGARDRGLIDPQRGKSCIGGISQRFWRFWFFPEERTRPLHNHDFFNFVGRHPHLASGIVTHCIVSLSSVVDTAQHAQKMLLALVLRRVSMFLFWKRKERKEAPTVTVQHFRSHRHQRADK